MAIRLLSIFIGLVTASARVVDVQHNILWHSTNSIFNSSVHDRNHYVVRIGERLRIQCPSSAEVSVIHRVDRHHADLCELPKERKSTVVGDCRIPGDTILVTFRDYSPVPGGLEFHPDKDYYFITTSTGENSESGLSNAVGGLCRSKNMKLRFLVLRKTQHHRQNQLSEENEHVAPPFSPDDEEASNIVPDIERKPIVESIDSTNDERESDQSFNGPLPFRPFGVSFWPSGSGAQSAGTVAPLMSDATRPVHASDGSAEFFGDNRIQEGFDYKIEYRYDDVNSTSPLRPTFWLLLAFVIFLIFSNR